MSDQTQRPTDSGDTREISLGEQPVEETKEPFAGAAEPEDTEPTQLIPDLPEDRLVPIEQEPELSVEKKKKKRKKKKKKTSPRSLLVTFLVAGAIIGISILISTIALAGFNDVFALDKPDLTVTVEIPTGSSTKEIAEPVSYTHLRSCWRWSGMSTIWASLWCSIMSASRMPIKRTVFSLVNSP